jgi:hypothetical protein
MLLTKSLAAVMIIVHDLTGSPLSMSFHSSHSTIAWDNGHVATVHHGDMREIQRAGAKPAAV